MKRLEHLRVGVLGRSRHNNLSVDGLKEIENEPGF